MDRDLKEVMMEAEGSRRDTLFELLKRKETESNVANAFSRVCDIYFLRFRMPYIFFTAQFLYNRAT
jgi:hypothetical protein